MAPLNSDDMAAQYREIVQDLLQNPHVFYSPPASPHKLLIPAQQIASLSLHPVIESLLHILNCDLASAHFLCRHAEVEPKWESMYVHGILHRVEGDIDNARAWYGQVKEADVFRQVWQDSGGGVAVPELAGRGWEHFLDRLERNRDRARRRSSSSSPKASMGPPVDDWAAEEEKLREASLWEIRMLLGVCEQRFGLRQVTDASGDFLGKIESGDAELARRAEDMVTGGEGWRKF